MKSALSAGFVASVLFVQQAASTNWADQPSFSNPKNTNNFCTPDQNQGFNWDKLPTGGFSSFDGFSFSGFDCKGSFQPKGRKRGLQPRNFQSKCIQGTVSKSGGSVPVISSGGQNDKFSITELDISVAFDTDIDLVFGMPDGSTCKHTAACKASGTTVKNSQCGGAKQVTFNLPPKASQQQCDFGIHSIRFDCQSTTTSTTTTTTRATTTTTPVTTTTTTPLTTTTTTTPPPVTTTTTTTENKPPPPPVTTTTTTTENKPPPPPPVTSSSTTTTTTENKPPPPPVTSTTTTTTENKPPPPPVTSTTTTTENKPPPPPVTTTTTTENKPPPPPVTSTTTTTTENKPPPPPVTTTTTTENKPPPPPPVTTTTTTTTPGEKPPPPTTSTTTSAVPPPPPPPPTTTLSTTTSTPPSPPPPTNSAPCPPVLPRCLNTWLQLVTSCSSNSDAPCFCPSSDFISEVQDCVSSWASSDDEITAALSYLAGICADFVPQNPGICTGVPTSITLVPVTSAVTETATVTNGNGRGPRPPISGPPGGFNIPVTTVTFTETIEGRPVTSFVTVPQVTFGTVIPTGAPGESQGPPAIGLVPFVPALATGGAAPAASGSVAVTGVAAKPTGAAAVTSFATTTGQRPATFTGAAGKTSVGFGLLAGALGLVAFLA